MKKIISFALALCLVVGVMFALTSCFSAIPGGTYTIEDTESTVEVKGNKMTLQEEIYNGVSVGIVVSFKVDGEEITLTYDSIIYDGDNAIVKGIIEEMEEEIGEEVNGTFSFEKGNGYFKIDGITYNKK